MDLFPNWFFSGTIVATHNMGLCPYFANQCFIKTEIFIAKMHCLSLHLLDESRDTVTPSIFLRLARELVKGTGPHKPVQNKKMFSS